MRNPKSLLDNDRVVYAWWPAGVSTLVLFIAIGLLFYASTISLTPCGGSIAHAASQCDVGDSEVFTGPVTFEGEIQAGATPNAGTAGFVLESQGSGSPAEWKRFTEIVKSSDETVNNTTTLQNDDDFQIAGAANTKYLVEALVLFDTSAVASIQFGWLLPAGATADAVAVFPSGADESVLYFTEAAAVAVTASGGVPNAVLITALIETAGTSGTVGLQWAQSTGEVSNTTVSANSWMIVKEN